MPSFQTRAYNAPENADAAPDAPRVGRSTRLFRNHDGRRDLAGRAAARAPTLHDTLRRQRKNAARSPKLAIVRALVAMGEAAARENGGTFVIDGYKLKKMGNSSNWYVAKYDKALGHDDRCSLGTEDEAEAKVMIALVVAEDPAPFKEVEDLPVEVAVELYLLSNETRNTSWASTSGSTLRGLERALPGVMVSEFTMRKQKVLITELAGGIAGRPMQVGSVANCLILIKAAVKWVCNPDEDGNRLCTTTALPIIWSKKDVAEVLDMPVPEPRNWHATVEETAAFLRLIRHDEGLRRWMVLALAFVCRADVAATASSEQIDLRRGVYHLNPKGRRQQQHKYRPSLPLPPSALAEMSTWGDGVWVGEEVPDLRLRFKAAGERLGLGPDFVPSSVRDFGATMLREAYVRYGVPVVIDQQHKMWMGHREESINNLYGQYSPSYLLLARNAIECILHELDGLSGGVLFRNARAAGTLPSAPVVIDPEKMRGIGMARLSGKSGNPVLPDEDAEGDKPTAHPIQDIEGVQRRPWGRAVAIGPKKKIAGLVRVTEGTIRQITATPVRGNGTPAPADLLQRIEEAGFRIFERLPPGSGPKHNPEIFIVSDSLKILSDEDTRSLVNAGTKWNRLK